MGKIQNIVTISDPTIEAILKQFLADQRKKLKPKTMADYEDAIDCLRDHLNGYAHQALSKPEAALFNKLYDAEGDEHREYCEIFGPDKIVGELSGFLGYFMVRKVISSSDFKRSAGTVVKKLSKWLAEKGYISECDAETGAEEGAEAARNLPRAERAAIILSKHADLYTSISTKCPDNSDLEFDHYTIARVEPGKMWVKSYAGGKMPPVGPIVIPKGASSLIEEGWDISCGLSRTKDAWRIAMMGNIYP